MLYRLVFFSVHSRPSPKPQKFAKGPKPIKPSGPRQQEYTKKWPTAIKQAQTQKRKSSPFNSQAHVNQIASGDSK
jgi:hypothetical protein